MITTKTKYYTLDGLEHKSYSEALDHEKLIDKLGKFVLIDIFNKVKNTITCPIKQKNDKHTCFNFDLGETIELSRDEVEYLVIPINEYNSKDVDEFLLTIEKWHEKFALKRYKVNEKQYEIHF